MKWDGLFSGRSLESVRRARLDRYFQLYEVEFGGPVPDYVTAAEDMAWQLELVWGALRRGVPLEQAPHLREVG